MNLNLDDQIAEKKIVLGTAEAFQSTIVRNLIIKL